MKDFEIFKKECKRLQNEWHLNGWTFGFLHQKLDGSNAQVIVDGENHMATFSLNIDLGYGQVDREMNRSEFIKSLAKHETIHVLLGRLTSVAERRWATYQEFISAEEELVRKLIKIIK